MGRTLRFVGLTLNAVIEGVFQTNGHQAGIAEGLGNPESAGGDAGLIGFHCTQLGSYAWLIDTRNPEVIRCSGRVADGRDHNREGVRPLLGGEVRAFGGAGGVGSSGCRRDRSWDTQALSDKNLVRLLELVSSRDFRYRNVILYGDRGQRFP